MEYLPPDELAVAQSESFLDAKNKAKKPGGRTDEFDFEVPNKQALDPVVIDMMAQMGYTALGPYSSDRGSFYHARLVPKASSAYTNRLHAGIANLKKAP